MLWDFHLHAVSVIDGLGTVIGYAEKEMLSMGMQYAGPGSLQTDPLQVGSRIAIRTPRQSQAPAHHCINDSLLDRLSNQSTSPHPRLCALAAGHIQAFPG